MFKKMFCLVIVMCMFAFIGCKNEVQTEVKLSDYLSVALEKTDSAKAKTTIAFSVSSENDFETKKGYYKKLVSQCFNGEVNNFRYEEEWPNSMVKFETYIPILNNKISENYLFSVVYTEKDTLFCMNKRMFKYLKSEIMNKLMHDFEIQDIDFEIKFVNDTERDIVVFAYANYINRTPCPYMTKQSMDDQIVFKLSDVSKDTMLIHKKAFLFEN